MYALHTFDVFMPNSTNVFLGKAPTTHTLIIVVLICCILAFAFTIGCVCYIFGMSLLRRSTVVDIENQEDWFEYQSLMSEGRNDREVQFSETIARPIRLTSSTPN